MFYTRFLKLSYNSVRVREGVIMCKPIINFKNPASGDENENENYPQQTRTYNVVFNNGVTDEAITFEASIPTINVRNFLRACFSFDDFKQSRREALNVEQMAEHFLKHGFNRIET